ncbi:LOW QUALITY PROTEIN: hypothetical protein M8C21_027385 [Ambrosia artemisiifolia]|uniref:Uncharacterized protein n=1 Tax=Ambrosia artemisiifolia TaxID=4212 RepID=A0AAD5GDX1_AMBAR|nr:LOW QUALITY PROTEIN: hypothetical protein M8C21_027385 [Ambrosia artemisiifolia]
MVEIDIYTIEATSSIVRVEEPFRLNFQLCSHTHVGEFSEFEGRLIKVCLCDPCGDGLYQEYSYSHSKGGVIGRVVKQVSMVKGMLGIFFDQT